MNMPTSITVTNRAENVFQAESGRLGLADSACRDFICFASPIIGAAYHYLAFVEAAERIAPYGYATTIVSDGQSTTIQQEIH